VRPNLKPGLEAAASRRNALAAGASGSSLPLRLLPSRRELEERAEETIGYEPEVMATEGDLVILRIVVGDRNPNKRYEADPYV
jgi:hypothetical protein